MSQRKHLIHVKSNQTATGTSDPKAPLASDLSYGEIAINYLADKERMFIKNSNNEIVSFVSSKVIEENEEVIAQALAVENEERIEAENEINDTISELEQTVENNERVSAAAMADLDSRISEVTQTVEDNELVIAAALSEINDKIDNLIEITYSELVSLKNGNNLSKGTYYRITDYNTTTVQENTQSANHPFDVIVLAQSNNTLSENAQAIQHAGDSYFTDCKLSAWELKYCIENDTDRFAWADPTQGKGVIFYMKDEWNNECPYDFKNIQFKRWAITSVKNSNNQSIDDLEDVFNYDSENNPICFGYQDSGYEMGSGSCTIDSNTSVFYYTLSRVDSNGNIMDNSIVGNTMGTDEDYYQGVINNVFKPSSNGINEVYGTNDTKTCLRLCDNVFVSTSVYDSDFPYGVFGNTFGTGCYHNTFGNGCDSNTFGNNCGSNTFGNECALNTFGNYCYYNTFGNNAYGNTFGNNCGSNTFGNYFRYNTFGNGCDSNTFGNDCWNNTFGNECYNNSFGNNCGSNTFGNYVSRNTFGNYCYYNTFGNNIQFIWFVKEVTNNGTTTEVGADYIYWCIVENGNKRIKVTFSSTTSSSSVAGNITITQGVNNAIYDGTNNSNWVNITNSDTIPLNNSTKTTNRTIYRPSTTTVDIPI